MSTSVFWTETMIELPEVREGGMSGRNEQRKPGTTRGSPRRSRTAKASRISRHAVKSRCAHEWDGWGRLSDDGPRHHNPDPSVDPWGGGVIPKLADSDSCCRRFYQDIHCKNIQTSNGILAPRSAQTMAPMSQHLRRLVY